MKLPLSELEFSFSRSSGAGGQNIQKVNTKVTLNWDLKSTVFYSPEIINRLVKLFPQYITDESKLQLVSQSQRTQLANKAQCLEKLKNLLTKAHIKPKIRKKTTPTRASKEIRFSEKKNRGEIKQNRKKIKF
jgi:ribosome-associated protein